MAISPVSGGGGFTPIEFPSVGSASPTEATPATNKPGFNDSLTNAIDGLQKTQTTADDLSMQVATGQLTNIHDYMIAANKAELATQLTVAVKNKAVDSFNQIMNMSV